MKKIDVNLFFQHAEDEMVSELGKLIAIPSVSSDLKNVKKALRQVLSLGKKLGFSVQTLLNDQIGIIEYIPECKYQEVFGILVHIDVVPPGELKVWKSDPFELYEKGGKLYGRGTLDDKGPLIASLYAMKAIKDSNIEIKKKIQLIIGTQEEVEWKDMQIYVKKYPLPDYGFTPDGEYPLCNIEKGIVDVVMAFPLDTSESKPGLKDSFTEDFSENKLRLISIDGGQALNAIPGKCTLKFENLETGELIEDIVLGKTVHSCQPEKGENAILKALDKISQLNLIYDPAFIICQHLKYYFSDMYGEKLDLYSKSEYYNGEFIHRNVFSITRIRTYEDRIEVGINSRTVFGTDNLAVIKKLKKIAELREGSLIYKHEMPAIYISKDRPFMKVFAEAYEDITGLKNRFTLAYGGSYAKAIENIVSWGPIFLGEEDTCHEENEYIPKDSLIKNAKIFTRALENIVFDSKSYK